METCRATDSIIGNTFIEHTANNKVTYYELAGGVHASSEVSQENVAQLDFCLVGGLALPKHGRCVDPVAPWAREQGCGPQEHGGTILPGKPGPVGLGGHRGRDRTLEYAMRDRDTLLLPKVQSALVAAFATAAGEAAVPVVVVVYGGGVVDVSDMLANPVGHII